MTPKEKAEELFINFYTVELLNGSHLDKEAAKDCALIAVDEIIKYSPNKPVEKFDPIDYFKKVKQEIINL